MVVTVHCSSNLNLNVRLLNLSSTDLCLSDTPICATWAVLLWQEHLIFVAYSNFHTTEESGFNISECCAIVCGLLGKYMSYISFIQLEEVQKSHSRQERGWWVLEY